MPTDPSWGEVSPTTATWSGAAAGTDPTWSETSKAIPVWTDTGGGGGSGGLTIGDMYCIGTHGMFYASQAGEIYGIASFGAWMYTTGGGGPTDPIWGTVSPGSVVWTEV